MIAKDDCIQHTYHASVWEIDWMRRVSNMNDNTRSWKDGCKWLENEKRKIKTWMQLWKEREYWDRHRMMSATWDVKIISHHNFTNICSGKVSLVPIEPLIGFLRHPLFQQYYCQSSNTWSHIVDKNYMFPMWHFEIPQKNPDTRYFLFDLGAGFGPGGSGQNWFTRNYANRGIHFDRILAWEAKTYNFTQYLDKLPSDVYDIISFYNVAVDSASMSKNNPLRIIRNIAKPKDFVALKIDIDDSEVEEALVHQILNDSTVWNLIDELYWEHHVRMSPMQYKGWGSHLSHVTNHTLTSSYYLFNRLRKLGIRAHSWI